MKDQQHADSGPRVTMVDAARDNGAAQAAPAAPARRSVWRISRDGISAALRPLNVLRRGRAGRNGAAVPAEAGVDGVQRVTARVDEWFEGELVRLETEAAELAQAAAAANLPRLDVAYEEVEEEARLGARCRSLLHGWAERVRTAVDDALQASTRRAGSHLKAYEHEIGALDGSLTALRETQAELRAAEAAAAAGEAQLEVRPFFARWKYIILITLLVLVDWVANVPVFTELLPKDPGADAAWRELAARSEEMGLLGGLYRMAARALHSIDASLLALGVIVFLVFLAHVLGESLRRLSVHSEKDAPAAAPTIRAQRRQFRITTVLSFVGIVGVVGFLWLARDQLERSTAQRVAETDARMETVRAQLATAQTNQDLAEVGALQQQVEGLRVLREQRAERADYALVISRMNLPILLLNIVLAIAAAVAGYLVTRDSIRGMLHSPRGAALRARLQELRTETARRHDELTRLDAAAAQELSLTAYLLASRPLRGWEARADRLRAVIPQFRSQNARMRGIDTANIAAFTRPPRLELPVIATDEAFAEPAELATYRELHHTLRQRAAVALQRLQHETPNTGNA